MANEMMNEDLGSLSSPYAQKPSSLPSPVPNISPEQPMPQAPAVPSPQPSVQMQEQVVSEQPPVSAPADQEYDPAIAEVFDDIDPEVSAVFDDIDTMDRQPNPIDTAFAGKELEGSALFGLLKIRQTKDGTIETFGQHKSSAGANIVSDKPYWKPITPEEQSLIADTYEMFQEGKISGSSLAATIASSLIPGGSVVKGIMNTVAAGLGAAGMSKFIQRPASDKDEYLFRAAAGLTDQQIEQSRNALVDGAIAMLGQGIGEGVSGYIANKSKKELLKATKAVERANAFRTAENISNAAKELGIELTPEQALAASQVESDVLEQAKQIVSSRVDTPEIQKMKSDLNMRIKRSEDQLVNAVNEMIKENIGDTPLSELSIRKRTYSGGMEKNFLDSAIESKKMELANVKGEIMKVAGSSQQIPLNEVLRKSEEIIGKRLSEYPIFNRDGSINAQKLFQLNKESRAVSKDMGSFISTYENLRRASTRQIGELGNPQRPLMKDVFSNATEGGFVASQDPLVMPEKLKTYIGTGREGSLPGPDISTMVESEARRATPLGSRVDYPYGRQPPLPGQTMANPESRFLQGDSLSAKGKRGSTDANVTLDYLSKLTDKAQELANFDGASRTPMERSFGELSHSLRELEADYMTSIASKANRPELAKRVLNLKDFYANKIPRLEVLQGTLDKNLHKVGELVYKRGPEMIDLIENVVTKEQMGEIRGQYLKTSFFDAMFENTPSGTKIKNPAAAAENMLSSAHRETTERLFGVDGANKIRTMVNISKGLNTLKAGGAAEAKQANSLARIGARFARDYGVPIDSVKVFAEAMLPNNPVARESLSKSMTQAIEAAEAKAASQFKKAQSYRSASDVAKKVVPFSGAATSAAGSGRDIPKGFESGFKLLGE